MFRLKLPTRTQVANIWPLNYLASHLTSPRLWAFRRHSVAYATAWGLFCAYLPIPFQMPLATLGCIIWSINLPVSLACVWVSNPITIPFLFYFAFLVGDMLVPSGVTVTIEDFKSIEAVFALIAELTVPVLVGCFLLGTILAVLGFFTAHYVWLIWARRRLVNILRIRELKACLHEEKMHPPANGGDLKHPDAPAQKPPQPTERKEQDD